MMVPAQVTAAWDVTVNIDGTTIIEPDSSLRPYIDSEANRVMLAVRSVVRALGGSVSWSRYADGTIQVTVYARGETVVLWTGRRLAQVAGRWHELYTAPVISAEGRVFLGMRDVFELLEVAVGWDDDHRIAVAYTDRSDVMDDEAFKEVERFFDDHRLLWERFDGDTPIYEVADLSGEESVTFPVTIRPHYVAQYLRSVEDANYMTHAYENMYAYADPPNPIIPAAEVSAQRAKAREQARLTVDSRGRRQVDAVSSAMRRYRMPDGTYVEVTPSGERQWLYKEQALELYAKLDRAGSFSGTASAAMLTSGAALVNITTLARAWPYGTLFAGVLLGATAWHYNSLAKKMKEVCLPGGNEKGIEYIQKYIRAPRGLWDRLEETYRDQDDVDRRVGRIILAIPATCHAWNGGRPW